MTFDELKIKLDNYDLKEADWTQHVCGGWIYKTAMVEGGTEIYGVVSGNAQVSGNARVSSPLFIVGSKHSLTNCKHGFIQISCYCKTFADWLNEYEQIGKDNNYTEQQIAEYHEYIQLFQKSGK